MFVVLALYEFTPLPDCDALAARLRELCGRLSLRGTLILAEEGINGTVAGTRAAIDELRKWFRAEPRFAGLEAKESSATEMPFLRLKVLRKPEIVTLGVSVEPGVRTGTHVDPADWNALLDDPDVVVIDCRNDFEVGVGSFPGARDPSTTSFADFPEFAARHLDRDRHRRIAMFCTGGIRCEKASSFLLDAGFDAVYQLRGGILRYLAEMPAAANRFRGECFVFDRRVSLTHGLHEGSYRECHGCKHPVSPEQRQSPQYEPDVSCPTCFDSLTEETRNRRRERAKQIALAAARGASHLGPPATSSRVAR